MKSLSDPTIDVMYECRQDNSPTKSGVKGAFGPACLNDDVWACQAHYGNLIAGGWDYFDADALWYGLLPRSYLYNIETSSSYVEKMSTIDQNFTASTIVAGAFAETYAPRSRMCLEVYDWGKNQLPYRVYVTKSFVVEDCIYPGDKIRTLTVKGRAYAGHMMWVVATLHSEQGNGLAHFVVAQVSHNIY